ADPSDRLLEVLRRLGATKPEATSSDRLAEDLHLDSLAMVQLQSTLETRFGLELSDAAWGEIKTVGDVRALLQQPVAAPTEAPSESPLPAPIAASSPPSNAAFPRWPWQPSVRALRISFLE